MDAQTFAALGHELRLSVYRLLLRHAPDGLSAGEIALRLDVPPSTLSTHLAQLERAGLLRSRREQRRILYAIDIEGTTRLVGFLVDDCCGGNPALCGYAPAEVKRKQRSKK